MAQRKKGWDRERQSERDREIEEEREREREGQREREWERERERQRERESERERDRYRKRERGGSKRVNRHKQVKIEDTLLSVLGIQIVWATKLELLVIFAPKTFQPSKLTKIITITNKIK